MEELTTADLFYRSILNQEDSFSSMELKGRIGLDSPDFAGSGTFVIRMKKDSVLWARVTKFGLEIARVSISPEKTIFINRIQREYVEVNTELFVSTYLKMPLDFKSVMLLVLGDVPVQYNAIPPLKLDDNNLQVKGKMTSIPGMLDVIYANPETKPIFAQAITDSGHRIEIKNGNFHELEGISSFPSIRHYEFQQGRDEYIIDMEISSLDLNKDLTYPIDIPSGYKRKNW